MYSNNYLEIIPLPLNANAQKWSQLHLLKLYNPLSYDMNITCQQMAFTDYS